MGPGWSGEFYKYTRLWSGQHSRWLHKCSRLSGLDPERNHHQLSRICLCWNQSVTFFLGSSACLGLTICIFISALKAFLCTSTEDNFLGGVHYCFLNFVRNLNFNVFPGTIFLSGYSESIVPERLISDPVSARPVYLSHPLGRRD